MQTHTSRSRQHQAAWEFAEGRHASLKNAGKSYGITGESVRQALKHRYNLTAVEVHAAHRAVPQKPRYIKPCVNRLPKLTPLAPRIGVE
ncbi:hypothetical protein, partial [Propionivibrio sp.]|uniref:hypothetical protein n=1 Tax=Propionivibrio sp. TaxID=2212460 RepID=UPI003BF179EB